MLRRLNERSPRAPAHVLRVRLAPRKNCRESAVGARFIQGFGLARALLEHSGMSKPIPSIQKFMTTSPHSIGGDQTLATASRMMHEHRIRHLPVLSGGKLRGLLTDRDLKLVETFSEVNPATLTVDEAMLEEPYLVSPDAPLDEVAATMAAQKYGSAVVVQNQHVVGIFTTVDACRALSELLTSRLG